MTPAPMRVSDAGVAFVADHEGFRDRVYRDQAGHDTIGFGHKLLPGESFPDGIDRVAALALLRRDLLTPESAVNGGITVTLTQNQFDALVDFTFNLGAGSFRGSSVRSLINAAAWQAAGQAFLLWCIVHIDGAPVRDPGLLKRRQDERALFLKEPI